MFPNIVLIVPYIERLNNGIESGYIYVLNIDSLDQSQSIVDYLMSCCLDVDIILKSKNQLIVEYKMKETDFWKSIIKTASKVVFPIIARKGVENWLILTENLFKNKKTKYFDVNLDALEWMIHHVNEISGLIKLVESLTPNQRDLIKKAYFGGYFEYPRGISIKDIAEDYGVSPNTIAKRLKNVEKKLISWFVNLV